MFIKNFLFIHNSIALKKLGFDIVEAVGGIWIWASIYKAVYVT